MSVSTQIESNKREREEDEIEPIAKIARFECDCENKCVEITDIKKIAVYLVNLDIKKALKERIDYLIKNRNVSEQFIERVDKLINKVEYVANDNISDEFRVELKAECDRYCNEQKYTSHSSIFADVYPTHEMFLHKMNEIKMNEIAHPDSVSIHQKEDIIDTNRSLISTLNTMYMDYHYEAIYAYDCISKIKGNLKNVLKIAKYHCDKYTGKN